VRTLAEEVMIRMLRSCSLLFGLSVVLLPGCTAPSALQVVLSPAEPTTADNLLASVQRARGDPEDGAFRFEWFQDGVERTDLENLALLPSAQTTRGEVWQVVATAAQADDTTIPLQSNSAIILNSLPKIVLVTITPDSPDSSTSLGVEVAGWEDPDGDAPVYSYRWSVDSGTVGDDVAVLESAHFVRGQQVVVEVTPSDGEDSGLPVSSEAVTIGNSAPTSPRIAVLPIHPIAAQDELLCLLLQDSVDPDNDPVSYSVEWIVDGTSYPDGNSSAGWTGPTTTTIDSDTVPAEDGEADQDWTCSMAASDGTAAAAAQRTVTLSDVDRTASDFSLVDTNLNSPTSGDPVSPRDYLCKVSGWYFGHST